MRNAGMLVAIILFVNCSNLIKEVKIFNPDNNEILHIGEEFDVKAKVNLNDYDSISVDLVNINTDYRKTWMYYSNDLKNGYLERTLTVPAEADTGSNYRVEVNGMYGQAADGFSTAVKVQW
jgi:hypothetical protein